MIEREPYYYRKSKVVKDLFDAIQMILDMTDKSIDEADIRLFITTTDDFTLHERDVGLAVSADTDETRRARVIARIQGNGMLTVEALKELVTLYEKSGCTVIEDYPNYTVTLHFNYRMGIPNNIVQLIEAIEEVKPAHISFVYLFDRNIWRRVEGIFKTWGAASAYTWDGLTYFGD